MSFRENSLTVKNPGLQVLGFALLVLGFVGTFRLIDAW